MYDGPAPVSHERHAAIVAAAVDKFRLRSHAGLKLVTYRLLPLAAAAVIIFAVVLTFTWSTPSALAAGREIARRETIAAWASTLERLLPSRSTADGPAAVRAAIQEAQDRLESLKIAAAQGPVDLSANKDIQRVLEAYKDLFRPLRDLGDWDAVFAAIHEAVDYARVSNPTGGAIDEWVAVYLDDLGSTYAVMGDYAQARTAYTESLDVRRRVVERDVAHAPVEQARAAGISSPAQRIAPLYWRLSYLSILEGDLSSARASHATAESLLRDYFLAATEPAGQSDEQPALDAVSALQAYRAAPEEFRNPPEWPSQTDEEAFQARFGGLVPNASIVAKLREHLFREARLRRVEGDYAGARQALDEAASVAPYPVHDESRLDFNEPLEAARVSILLGDPDAALGYLAEAERHSGAVAHADPHGADLSKRPIAPLRVAEMSVLKASALLAAGRDKANARQLVRDAIELRDAFAERLSGDARVSFLRQFRAWDELANAR